MTVIIEDSRTWAAWVEVSHVASKKWLITFLRGGEFATFLLGPGSRV